MVIRKITVENRIMDVIDEDEYLKRSKMSDPLFEDTCVEHNGYVYPIRRRLDPTVAGVFDAGPLLKYTKPIENVEAYNSDNIIDFSKAKDLRELIEKQGDLKRGEEAILLTKDNITIPDIAEDDMPELVAIKRMIIDKNIDIDSYRNRFETGSDFNNAIRPIKDKTNKTISFYRAKGLCDALDVKMTLMLEDKQGAVNPMGKKIVMELTTSEE